MSKREITRLEVMQRLKDKRLTQKEAARTLGISIREVKRQYREYKVQRAAEHAPRSPACGTKALTWGMAVQWGKCFSSTMLADAGSGKTELIRWQQERQID